MISHPDTPTSKTRNANPVLAEATRGAMVESYHRGAFCVVDVTGRIVLKAGDTDRPVYARSAIKPIQALPLVETGALDAFGLGDAELALACASHSGEAGHVARVAEWLDRIGLDEEALECGASLPMGTQAAEDLLRSGGRKHPLQNNCSGKHAGFLAIARHLGFPTGGYIRYDHPVQQRVLGVLKQMTGMDLGSAPRGTDGCGIPVIGIPIGNIALAMARLADPSDQPEQRQEAAMRVRRAMTGYPELVGGTGRFDTRIMAALNGAAIVKVGAQGVYCGALPQAGLGIALKIDDGDRIAAEVVMGKLLQRLDILTPENRAGIADLLEPPILNVAGLEVGCIRPADGVTL